MRQISSEKNSQPYPINSTAASPSNSTQGDASALHTFLVKSSWLQRFRDLPIRNKQLLGLMTSEAISVIGLVGVGVWLIISSGRAQLLNQAKAELVVSEINYNIKVNQMGFGFRGQSDNVAIIAAAKAHEQRKPLDNALKQQVRSILQNEVKARKIEYATLVGTDLGIIVNANADRSKQSFNPDGFVTQVLRDPKQLKASAIVTWNELQKENPPLPSGFRGKDALIRYTATPVREPGTDRVIGVLVSGDIVNGKDTIVRDTVKAFGSGYSAVYLRQPNGGFALTTALDKLPEAAGGQETANLALPDDSLLQEAANADGQAVAERMAVGQQTYTVAAKALNDISGKPLAILVRGTSEAALNQLTRDGLTLQLIVTVIAIAINILLAIYLGWLIADPLRKLRQTTQEFSEGNLQARAEVESKDEVGQLAETFNQMANQITFNMNEILEKESLLAQEAQDTETARQQAIAARQEAERLAEEQRQQRERLQQRALQLLQEVDPINQGDLTVKAKVTPDEIGTLADSYNAIVENLRQIVSQVQTAVAQVSSTATSNETTVRDLSQETARRSLEITAALEQVERMANSVQEIASHAEQAEIAVQQAAETVKTGDEAMNRTVDGIQAIRVTVAEAAKKVKHLGESSQKISTVVDLISAFATQTKTLALNASIEAALAGQEGRGFAIVAEEVRALARRSAAAADEIKALVSSIQVETNEVVMAMEAGTEQVVVGTQLVDETRQSLNRITATSARISELVEAIAQATVVQTQASQTVTQTMEEVAVIANQASVETEQVSQAFEQLRQLAQTLQADVSQFKVS